MTAGTCTEADRGADRSPVEGMFIDRHCGEIFHACWPILEIALYRDARQQGRAFSNATRLEIFRITG